MTENDSVFICYRCDDAQTEATAIESAVSRLAGDQSVFLDASSIQAGETWPNELERALQNASTMLVLIGPLWLKAQTEFGHRRLDEPDDWVRREIEHGLATDKKIVPVLLRGAEMPPREALPSSIEALATKQNVDIKGNLDADALKDLLGRLGLPTKDDAEQLHAAPEFGDIVSRRATLADLAKRAEKTPLISVVGLSGTGKTYLVSDFVSQLGMQVLWYDAQNDEPIDDLLASIQTQVKLGEGTPDTKCKRLANWLAETNSVLIIDDFHKGAQETYAAFLRAVLGRAGALRVILISQTHVEIQNLNTDVIHFEVRGLTAEELQQFLKSRNVDVSAGLLDRLHGISDGLPFAAGLFSTLVGHFGLDPNDLLQGNLLVEDRITGWCERVLNLVEKDDRSVLARLSVSDAPFNRSASRALAAAGGISEPTANLGRLRRAYLLQSYTPYRWRVHPILAAYSRGTLSPADLRDTRIALAEHLIRGLPWRRGRICDPDELLWKSRACRHFARAGAFGRAIDLAHDISATVKAYGEYALFLDVVSLIPDEQLSLDAWLQYHVAHCLIITGQFIDALEQSQKVQSVDDATLALAAARIHAEALSEVDSVSAGIAVISQALSAADAKVSSTIMRQAESTETSLAIRLGDFELAGKRAADLLAQAKDDADERGAAVALTHLGTIRRLQGDVEDAENLLKAAKEFFGNVPDRRGIVWSCGQLALAQLDNSPIESLEYARIAVSTAAEIGLAGHSYAELLDTLMVTNLPVDLEAIVKDEMRRLKGRNLKR